MSGILSFIFASCHPLNKSILDTLLKIYRPVKNIGQKVRTQQCDQRMKIATLPIIQNGTLLIITGTQKQFEDIHCYNKCNLTLL